jgi:hypothetical protein
MFGTALPLSPQLVHSYRQVDTAETLVVAPAREKVPGALAVTVCHTSTTKRTPQAGHAVEARMRPSIVSTP